MLEETAIWRPVWRVSLAASVQHRLLAAQRVLLALQDNLVWTYKAG